MKQSVPEWLLNVRQVYYPNLQSVAHTMSFGDADVEQEQIVYGKSSVQPEVAYYFRHIR